MRARSWKRSHMPALIGKLAPAASMTSPNGAKASAVSGWAARLRSGMARTSGWLRPRQCAARTGGCQGSWRRAGAPTAGRTAGTRLGRPTASSTDHLRRIAALEQVAGLLNWDQETQMPPKGAAQRAEQAAAVAAAIHAQASDPRIPDWIAAAGPQDAAGAVNLAEAARLHARATRIPARLAAELARAAVEGADRLGGGAGGERLRRLRAGARRGSSSSSARRPTCLAAEGRSGYDALLDDYEPGATAAELEALFARLRPGLAALRARIAEAGRPAPALRRALPARPRSSRCRGGSATSSATTGRRGGSISRCIPPRRAPAATCGSPPASTRPTRGSASIRPSTRSAMRSTSRGSTRRRRCCRRARTPRWGCTRASRGCSRTSSGAAAPSAPGSGRRCARAFGERRASTGRRRSTARSTRSRPASSAPRPTRSTTTCTSCCASTSSGR